MAEQEQDIDIQNPQQNIDVYFVPAYLKDRHSSEEDRKMSFEVGTRVREALRGSHLHQPRDLYLATKVSEDDVFAIDNDKQFLISFPHPQYNNATDAVEETATNRERRGRSRSASVNATADSGHGTSTNQFFFGQNFFAPAADGVEGCQYSITQADVNSLNQIRDRIAGLTVSQSLNHASGPGGIAQSVGPVTQNHGQRIADTVKAIFASALENIINNNTNVAAKIVERTLIEDVISSLEEANVLNSEEHVRCAVELIGKIFDVESANKLLTELGSRSTCNISALSQGVQMASLTAALSDVRKDVKEGFAQLLTLLATEKVGKKTKLTRLVKEENLPQAEDSMDANDLDLEHDSEMHESDN